MATFPSLEWFKEYQKLLEQDEESRKYYRWFKGSIIFRINQQCFLLKFDNGIVDLSEGYGAYDILINGSLDAWKILLNEDKTINRLYRTGGLEIRGNPIEIMKNWRSFFYITQCLKKVEI
ncbi:MAG: SCP2 sterol-binding domain-containing protein [Pseudomonadota bacterium]|jgi:hypothetical protein